MPINGGCPAGTSEQDGSQLDPADNCVKAPVAIVCTTGPVTGDEECWVDTDTGEVYLTFAGTCKPDSKWRDCTMSEQSMLDSFKDHQCN